MYMKHPTTLYTVKCGKCMISPTRRLRAHAVTLLHLFPVSWTIGFCRERLVYVGWSGLLLLPHSLPDSLGGWFTWITFVTGSYTHSLASSPLQRSGLLGTNSGLRFGLPNLPTRAKQLVLRAKTSFIWASRISDGLAL
jgi:hypothetical protein